MPNPRFTVIALSLVTAAIVAVCATAIVLVLNPGHPGQGSEPRIAAVTPVTPVDDGVTQDSEKKGGQTQDRSESGARAAAQDLLDSYSAGNYGAFWDGWTADAQKLISRDDYMRIFQLCKPIAQGLRYTIQSVTVQGDTAKTQVALLIGAFTYDFTYEDGKWRFVPDAEAQADYRSKSADQIAADRQADLACANGPTGPTGTPTSKPDAPS